MNARRAVLCLVVTALVFGTAGAVTAQATKYTDGPDPVIPQPVDNSLPPQGTLTFYPDRGAFQAAHPGLPVEDFTGTLVPPKGIVSCPGPLNNSTNDACFPSGGVIPGFELDPQGDGGKSGNGSADYVVLNDALTPCVAVGPNFFADETDWTLSPAVAAVAFDFYWEAGADPNFTIDIVGPGGTLGSVPFSAPGGGTPAFFGVDTIDPGGITAILIRENSDGNGELFCDFEFGGAPVPVDLQSIDVD